jgi:hypothetical protein
MSMLQVHFYPPHLYAHDAFKGASFHINSVCLRLFYVSVRHEIEFAALTRTCSMDMNLQHRHGRAVWTWTCSMDMDMQHEHGHAA